MLDTILYILGNKPITLSLYVDWIPVLSYLIFTFTRPYDFRPLLTSSIWMAFDPRRRSSTFASETRCIFLALQTFRPYSASFTLTFPGWHLWSICLVEVCTVFRWFISILFQNDGRMIDLSSRGDVTFFLPILCSIVFISSVILKRLIVVCIAYWEHFIFWATCLRYIPSLWSATVWPH